MTATQEPDESQQSTEAADAGNLLFRTQKEIDSLSRAVNKYRKTCLYVYPIGPVGTHLLSHGSPKIGPQPLGVMESFVAIILLACRWTVRGW